MTTNRWWATTFHLQFWVTRRWRHFWILWKTLFTWKRLHLVAQLCIWFVPMTVRIYNSSLMNKRTVGDRLQNEQIDHRSGREGNFTDSPMLNTIIELYLCFPATISIHGKMSVCRRRHLCRCRLRTWRKITFRLQVLQLATHRIRYTLQNDKDNPTISRSSYWHRKYIFGHHSH